MTGTTVTMNPDGTISTLSLLVKLNEARLAAGENEIRNTDFIAKVEDELDDLGEKREIRLSTKPSKYYDLTEDQAKQVAMRESKAVRKAVVAELNRLYAKAKETPKSPLEVISEALALAHAQIELMTPKAAVHDRFMAAEGSRSLRDTAKALGHGPHKFNKQLHADGYLFKQGSVWEPYADHIESGLFVLTVREVNGTNQKQTRVTPKGMDALATRYPVKEAA